MSQTVSDFILERLRAWGVKRVFGYPGDGVNGLLGAFGHKGADLDFVQVRHEEMAAFMACAHAKLTGEVGVCLATSGPGAIHLLNGLYDAKADHQPVVALVGQTARTAMGGDFQQEVDLGNLFKDVAHEYVQTAMSPVQIRHLIDRAFRNARATRSVTALIFPQDLQMLPAVKKPPHDKATVHTGVGYLEPRIIPRQKDLEHAAEVINAGKRVAILVGQGARGAGEEVERIAELTSAGVATALLGKDVLPGDLPYVTGCIGLLGTRASDELMSNCDTLLMVGSCFPYPEFLPEEGQARGVQIDIDARRLSLRYPMEVPLMGDAAETLRALLPLVRPHQDGGWRRFIEGRVNEWNTLVEKRAKVEAEPLNPQRVFYELSPRLPNDAMVLCDTGTVTSWYARDVQLRRGMRGTVSGGLASMGCGMPYALAAKLAYPDRAVVALCGDGAMQMNGNAELITLAKYWHRWPDARFVVLVLNNRDLNMVTWEMRAMGGEPKLPASQTLPDFPYAKYAESLGLEGIRVDRPEQVGPAWERAFAADKPVVIEAFTDPNVPPLPPHLDFEFAKHYARAMTHGDPDAWATVRASMKQVLARF